MSCGQWSNAPRVTGGCAWQEASINSFNVQFAASYSGWLTSPMNREPRDSFSPDRPGRPWALTLLRSYWNAWTDGGELRGEDEGHHQSTTASHRFPSPQSTHEPAPSNELTNRVGTRGVPGGTNASARQRRATVTPAGVAPPDTPRLPLCALEFISGCRRLTVTGSCLGAPGGRGKNSIHMKMRNAFDH
jgi:hypothetical protein